QARHDLEKRGLAAATGAEQGDKGTLFDIKVDAVQGGIAFVALLDRADAKIGRSGHQNRLDSWKRRWPSTITTMVKPTIIAAMAIVVGSIPSVRSREKVRTGKVIHPAPAMKVVTTTSLNETRKAMAVLESRPGMASGSVMRRTTCQGEAPRLLAAASRRGSISSKVAIMMRAAKGMVMVTCARISPGRVPLMPSWA